jgi:hypothetical protein
VRTGRQHGSSVPVTGGMFSAVRAAPCQRSGGNLRPLAQPKPDCSIWRHISSWGASSPPSRCRSLISSRRRYMPSASRGGDLSGRGAGEWSMAANGVYVRPSFYRQRLPAA